VLAVESISSKGLMFESYLAFSKREEERVVSGTYYRINT